MKKIYILLFFIVILSILSCSSPYESNKEKTSPNPDISLKGTWSVLIYGEFFPSIKEFEAVMSEDEVKKIIENLKNFRNSMEKVSKIVFE